MQLGQTLFVFVAYRSNCCVGWFHNPLQFEMGTILAIAMKCIVFLENNTLADYLLQPIRAFKISFGHTFESNLIPEESALEMNKLFL